MTMMSFKIGDITLELEASKGSLRWAVGNPDGPRSATWRFWGNPKGDFYLAVRSVGGIFKTSFHKDGRCHTGFTSDYAGTALARFPGFPSRHADRWTLPALPVVRVMQILVPGSELRVFPSDEKQMRWIPAPPVKSVVVVSIFLCSPHALSLWPAAKEGAQPLGVMTTPVRWAWVVFTGQEIDAQLSAKIAEGRARLTELDGVDALPTRPDVRSILWGSGDGGRFYVELAYDRE